MDQDLHGNTDEHDNEARHKNSQDLRYRHSLEWIVLHALQKNKTGAYREILHWRRNACPELARELNAIFARLRIAPGGVYYLLDLDIHRDNSTDE